MFRAGLLYVVSVFLFLEVVSVRPAAGQKVIVDADFAHVANAYSPVHSIGAAIDRLRTGTPDGQWALTLVNREQSNDHPVKVAFDGARGAERFFSGNVDRITFGSNEYAWRQEGIGGHADPDGPPARSTVRGSADTLYLLPKASITILRGKLTQ